MQDSRDLPKKPLFLFVRNKNRFYDGDFGSGKCFCPENSCRFERDIDYL